MYKKCHKFLIGSKMSKIPIGKDTTRESTPGIYSIHSPVVTEVSKHILFFLTIAMFINN